MPQDTTTSETVTLDGYSNRPTLASLQPATLTAFPIPLRYAFVISRWLRFTRGLLAFSRVTALWRVANGRRVRRDDWSGYTATPHTTASNEASRPTSNRAASLRSATNRRNILLPKGY